MANGDIITASLCPVALANDDMLPAAFPHASKRENTPFVALIATGVLIAVAVLPELDLLIKAASTVILLSNIFASLSAVVMRESTIANLHVIVEGTNIFRLVLVRAAEGVHFGSGHPFIRAVFILIGTRDMRNLHLCALAAIAQVVQHAGFEHGWLSAKGHRELKDLFLLSKRQRKQEK